MSWFKNKTAEDTRPPLEHHAPMPRASTRGGPVKPLMGEPKLDPAYAVEMTERERNALMQADDWSWMLERFFVMEFPVGDRSYES